ncbi:MAG: BirA family transcriptional regulator [Blastocatellia bacterium]|jgi:BirA family biotin operon repressor/biotin-[acetyl-CoA-carboxylase] ligase|nr:BirA family transcriptional regulator [Blastocatellia bacterium]
MSVANPTILRFDSIDSTNLEAMRQARAGAPEGLCIIAREQTHGRGRQGRNWLSAKDAGLYFTAVLRPQIDLSSWPLITLMSALAVANTLRDTCALSADIKWPNDLILNQRKIAGILCETVDTGAGYAVVVGIGINLYQNALPIEVSDTATSIEQESGLKPDLEAILSNLIKAIARRYVVLQTEGGTEQTIQDWSANSSYATGKHVRIESGAEVFTGVTNGLENDGALRVVLKTGEVKVVRAGDVQSLRGSDIRE